MNTRKRLWVLQFKATGLLISIFGGIALPGLYGAHRLLVPGDYSMRTIVGATITVAAALLARFFATSYYESGLDDLQKEDPDHG